jgi:anti-sigma factor RsiW
MAADRAAELGQHIAKCPGCAAEIAALVHLKRQLRTARTQFTPSAEFRRRIQRQIAAPARRTWLFRLVPAAALALALVLAITSGWNWYSRGADSYAEFADLHVNALASTNTVDVVSSNRHTVKPWFQGKIPFSFNVPELAGTDFNLLGGRMVYFHQNPGAQLIVAARQHKISVLIFQENEASARSFPVSTDVLRRSSFSMETWRSQQLRFVLISDADAGSVERLARAFRDANR